MMISRLLIPFARIPLPATGIHPSNRVFNCINKFADPDDLLRHLIRRNFRLSEFPALLMSNKVAFMNDLVSTGAILLKRVMTSDAVHPMGDLSMMRNCTSNSD